jgi:CRP-like cAMP-binding protein
MARNDPRLGQLRQVYLFAGFSDKDLKKLAGIADLIDLGPGHVLCAEGHLAQECFILVEGRAEVRVGGQVVAEIGPGESVGEMGLINRKPRSATVVTTTPVSAYVIDARRFRALLRETPAFTEALLAELSDRVRNLDVAYRTPAPA